MHAYELLRTLAVRGATATFDGDLLWVEPSEILTDELREIVRVCKQDLVELLDRKEIVDPSRDRIKNIGQASQQEIDGAVDIIINARRGVFLCYGSPGFAETWRWVNELTSHNLTSRELMRWVRENGSFSNS